MARYARTPGAPVRSMLLEEQSRDTIENARCTEQAFVRPHRRRRVLIVTSDFHSTRTLLVFQRVLGSRTHVACTGVQHSLSALRRVLYRSIERCIVYSTRLLLAVILSSLHAAEPTA